MLVDQVKSLKRYLFRKKNLVTRLLASRRLSAKVLMTEPDIAHAVKEIWGARVVYVRLAKVTKFDQIG